MPPRAWSDLLAWDAGRAGSQLEGQTKVGLRRKKRPSGSQHAASQKRIREPITILYNLWPNQQWVTDGFVLPYISGQAHPISRHEAVQVAIGDALRIESIWRHQRAEHTSTPVAMMKWHVSTLLNHRTLTARVEAQPSLLKALPRGSGAGL
eukprot:215261-Pelagomonas_calceolata.AAC.1